MRFEDLMKSAGLEIVRAASDETKTTLFIRVHDTAKSIWVGVVNDLLLTAARSTAWAADVSKMFYVDRAQGVVRYLWRIVLSGDQKTGVIALSTAVREQRPVHELNSQPLVGRAEYEFDPDAGKIKGAHNPAESPTILSRAGVGRR